MVELISQHVCFDGVQGFYKQQSKETGLPMTFSVYQPPQAKHKKVPVLFYLAGLTCTEETFMIKGGAQRYAAEHGIMLVSPDTSPRRTGIKGASDAWDFGHGAGFYIDATQAPWSDHFRMYSYVVHELRNTIISNFPALADRIGVFGHSMGGHGALTLALKNPDIYKSVSAFAPITAPSQCPWGEKAFSNYLGADRSTWLDHDASALMRARKTPFPQGILIDQGLDDQFLDTELLPHQFEAACWAADQPLTLRRHRGYDHNYYFISTFMQDHIAYHSAILNK
ncbi:MULTISPECIES: S-formylglutathione hydrolase [Oxalobacteraceae]|uniref:S-formylglutathione hydrolase n=1 Tax=Herminiimonas TaxID=303379 RepID=UPI001E5D6597|nr:MULTISPECIES: S-formylglutathione hydrolase [Oxalobacteraceae]